MVDIKIWTFKEDHWETAYLGSRENMPKKFKWDVALLDASDKRRIVGVGLAIPEDGAFAQYREYYLSEYYFGAAGGE